MFYIYFIRSKKNNKVYTGLTLKSPEDRVLDHNNGSNKYTRNNRPFVLLYYESYYCKKDAILREKFYKTGFGRKIRDSILFAVSARG